MGVHTADAVKNSYNGGIQSHKQLRKRAAAEFLHLTTRAIRSGQSSYMYTLTHLGQYPVLDQGLLLP